MSMGGLVMLVSPSFWFLFKVSTWMGWLVLVASSCWDNSVCVSIDSALDGLIYDSSYILLG